MAKRSDSDEKAKLGQQVLAITEKAGRWLDDAFGDGARQLGAAFNDSMTGFRVRNRLKVLEKTQKAIEKAGLSDATRRLPPRIMLPLWDAIGEESDDTLQGVWSAYIKNAVDPNKPNPDKILIEIIRKLEPSDWPLLKQFFASGRNKINAVDLGLVLDELESAMDRFVALGLFFYDDPNTGYLTTGDHERCLIVEIGIATYYETKFLRKLASSTSD